MKVVRPEIVIGDKLNIPGRGQAKVLAFKDGGLLVKVEGNNEVLPLESLNALTGSGGYRPEEN